jgi:hypothetical protein
MAEGPLLFEDSEESVESASSDWVTVKKVEIDTSNLEEEIHSTGSSINPKRLRHAKSSPNLRNSNLQRELHILEEAEEDDDDNDNDSESFAMVSGPGSVVSMQTFSFRDAILAKTKTTTPRNDTAVEPAKITASAPRIRQAKYIVSSIKRCTKSTGDLRSLAEAEVDVLGDTDAMDYYHRKALGAKGRVNGLRLRPDEAKRKEITMNKKQMQRANNS